MKLPDLTPLCRWYDENKRDLPFRHTKDPYRIWVSEIMLQQTRMEAALPYYTRFIETLPDIKALAEAPEELILKLWEGLGYYSRVRNMQKAAKRIMAEHGGVFPHTFEDILSLEGIGEYTAGAVASFAFGLPYPTVDGNVLRVTARLLSYEEDILTQSAKRVLGGAVCEELPRHDPGTMNQALMELGALVCLPNGAPKCDICPLSGVCLAHKEGKEETLPVRKKAKARRTEEKTVLLLRLGDRVVLRKRPETGLLAGLFEPFCLEGKQTKKEVEKSLEGMGLSPSSITSLGRAKHVFSHVEWHMTGFAVTLAEEAAVHLPADCLLVPREELDRSYALPSAYSAYRALI